jgi:hypothetical protein
MSTYDDNLLTKLVVMSHDRMLRVEINPRHYRYLEFVFHKRTNRDGPNSERIPELEDHVNSIRHRLTPLKPLKIK